MKEERNKYKPFKSIFWECERYECGQRKIYINASFNQKKIMNARDLYIRPTVYLWNVVDLLLLLAS